MSNTDNTFDEVSMYGSARWVAATLGISKDTFYAKRADLVKRGFPEPDKIIKHYIKADVYAWINLNRTIPDDTIVYGQDPVFAELEGFPREI